MSKPTTWQEYDFRGEVWVVQDFKRLRQLFDGITPELLPALHELGVSRTDLEWKTAWGMAKWLAGIRPVIVPLGVDEEKLRPLTEEQVALVYNTTPKGVTGALAYLQLAWGQAVAQSVRTEVESDLKEKPPTISVKPAQRSLTPSRDSGKQPLVTVNYTDAQLDLLRLAGFPTSIFDIHRSEFDRRIEADWFCERIGEVRKAFEEPMAKGVARLALLNELQLRRINNTLVTMSPSDKEFIKLQVTKDELEKRYGEQWRQLEELCPQSILSANRKETVRIFSDLISLWQKSCQDPNRAPRDGIFTDDEIQVLLRTSVQQPEVPYRLGWVLAANEAKLGINDPKWKRRMTKTECQVLDTGFAYAFKKLADRLHLPRPDLEVDGPEGEYPPLHLEADGDITEPLPLDEVSETPLVAAEISEPTTLSATP